MGIKDFKLKWASSASRGKPTFISNSKILVPCDFFIKTLDISRNYCSYHFEPGIRIGCCSALPELGIVAVSERKANGVIFVLRYPEMVKISTLEQGKNEMYSGLQFMGLEFLLSVQIQNGFEVDLWKWSSRQKVFSLSIPLSESEIPNVELRSNPLWWHQIMLQSNMRLILIEIKYSDDKDKYYLDAVSCFLLENEKSEIESFSKNCKDVQRDFQIEVIKPLLKAMTIQCFCWLPENYTLVATSGGILRIECEKFVFHKLTESKSGISSMILCKSSLFVGYKTGYIDVVNINSHRWILTETINVEQPITHTFMSPDYNFLVVATLKGSVILLSVGKGQLNLKTVLRSQSGEEVGVGFIGPLAKHCAMAKKNGSLQIFQTADGSILSTFQLDEDISKMATSPMCYCIVVGSSFGFLYFIDATNPRKPKVVHCERPYEIPIDNLKFDNFGRYLVASAQNQAVKIWNGLPSSGFTLLGSKNISTQVKEIVVFAMKEINETVLLLLTESGTASKIKTGNELIILKLPCDFCTDPKKYQVDVFGTLSEDIFSYQSRKLINPSCKMQLHWSLGAIFYSPGDTKIERYPVWSDFINNKENYMFSIKNVSDLCLSPNQHWIGIADFFGCVYLYSSHDFSLSASSENYYVSDSMSKSFVHVSNSSNNLVSCRENGTILYYGWIEELSCLPSVPEWVVYCCSLADKENGNLHSMEEEGRTGLVPQDFENNFENGILLSEIYGELEVWTCVMSFKLDELVDDWDTQDLSLPNPFAFDDNSLFELSEKNRKMLLIFMPEQLSKETTAEGTNHQNIVKTLSSISLGLTVENFAKERIMEDFKQANDLRFNNNETNNSNISSSINNPSFSKSVKFKCKEERLSTIKQLIYDICNLKSAFNEQFDILLVKKTSITHCVDESYSQAKMITHTLPSKAERDFWNAMVEQDCRFLKDSESENENDISQECHKYENKVIKEAKNSIEFHVKSAKSIQDQFDSDVENLLLKKRFCDYNIYRFELKIYSILLYALVEGELSKWRTDTEKGIKDFEGFKSEIYRCLKELSELEKMIKESYLEFQKLERKFSNKVDAKCTSNKSKEALKKQFPMQLNDSSQNPFWRNSPSVNIDDVTSVHKEFLSRNSCPSSVENSEWENICSKQIYALKVGMVMRNLQDQILFLTSTKLGCADAASSFKINIDTMQRSLKMMPLLISKFTINFHSLVSTLLESTDLNINTDTKSETDVSVLLSIPASDHQIWKDVDREIFKMQVVYQRLNGIDRLFEDLKKLMSDMFTKVSGIKKEYPVMMADTTEKLKEIKQNIANAKSVAEAFLKGRKKSMLKILKSHVFDDSTLETKKTRNKFLTKDFFKHN